MSVSVDTERTVRLTVNGVPREATVPVRRLLSDALRHDLGLTGTHVGCEHGVCGACTVLVDGAPVEKADWTAAGALARTLVDPDGDLHASADYRRLLVGVLTERTLVSAAAEASARVTGE